MKDDFASLKFNRSDYRKKNFKRVHFLQGKVQIDTDYNEQNEIYVRNEENNLKNIIGSSGTPQENGFKISLSGNKNYNINSGQYYVAGKLVENYEIGDADNQPYFPAMKNQQHPALPREPGYYIVYLDVYEQYITFLDDSELLEPALGGLETTGRSRNIWQVNLLKIPDGQISCENVDDDAASGNFNKWLSLINPQKGTLQVRTKTNDSRSRCERINADSYLGNENQLYRIEIYKSGTSNNGATFVWSRNNASIIANITEISGTTLFVNSTGKNKLIGFMPDQWIEITDKYRELNNISGTLVKIKTIDNDYQLAYDENSIIGDLINDVLYPLSQNPKIIAWDTKSDFGSIKIETRNEINEGFIPLENGIEVRFNPDGYYPRSAYWTFSARSIAATIDWPILNNGPKELFPEGVDHSYAMLAIIRSHNQGNLELVHDCRRKFKPLTEIVQEKPSKPVSLSSTVWVHGNTVSVQYPQRLAIDSKLGEFHRGNGTTYVQYKDNNWFQIPFTISNNYQGKVLKLKKIMILYSTTGNTVLKDIHVYDGSKIIARLVNLNLAGIHYENIDGSNSWIIDPPITVNFGLNISVNIDFNIKDVGGTRPGGVADVIKDVITTGTKPTLHTGGVADVIKDVITTGTKPTLHTGGTISTGGFGGGIKPTSSGGRDVGTRPMLLKTNEHIVSETSGSVHDKNIEIGNPSINTGVSALPTVDPSRANVTNQSEFIWNPSILIPIPNVFFAAAGVEFDIEDKPKNEPNLRTIERIIPFVDVPQSNEVKHDIDEKIKMETKKASTIERHHLLGTPVKDVEPDTIVPTRKTSDDIIKKASTIDRHHLLGTPVKDVEPDTIVPTRKTSDDIIKKASTIDRHHLLGTPVKDVEPDTIVPTRKTAAAGDKGNKDTIVITIGNGKQFGKKSKHFEPSNINVKSGSTVRWVNKDTTIHNITHHPSVQPSNVLFRSELLSMGKKFEFTFTKSGEFNYFCSMHPSQKGIIIVE